MFADNFHRRPSLARFARCGCSIRSKSEHCRFPDKCSSLLVICCVSSYCGVCRQRAVRIGPRSTICHPPGQNWEDSRERRSLSVNMNRCDRKFNSSRDHETSSEVGEQKKSASGARPKSRQQQQAPQKAVDGRPWTMSNSRRNGEGKLPRAATAVTVPNASCHSRESKTGAFDSLLKRANRRRSNASTSPGDKAPSKQAVRDDDGCARQEDAVEGTENSSEGADGNSFREGTARDAPLSESHESSAPTAEYTILARPDRQTVEAEAFRASLLRQGSEKDSAPSLPVVEVPQMDVPCKESKDRPSVQPVASYTEATSPYGHFSPPEDSVFVFPPRPNGYQHPVMSPSLPSARAAPGCVIDELSFLKLAESVQPCFPYHEMMPCPPGFPPLPSPPSPVMAAFGAANLPFHYGGGYFAGRLGGNRRRTKSFPRRLPERRLYDSHGRWVGQDARRTYQQDLPLDIADFVLNQDQITCKDGTLTYDSGGRESSREQRGEAAPRRYYGRRHYSASWSHPAVADDDIEDLLPLIDKLAVEYSNSDSSAEGSLEAQIPDEGAWFSVLPETTQPEDRFIWSPRRDLHRPKSIWSPLKPRLGCGPEDNLLDPYTRIKYRCRTYTETSMLPRAVGAFAEGRRSVSCELPYFDEDAARGHSATTVGAGWSPWSSQLPTADLLKAPTL